MEPKKRRTGVGIDLKETQMSVEQALRELKMLVEEDIEDIKQKRYYQKPSIIKREKNKIKRGNIRKYSKN